jgi:hypothetical protein
MKSLIHQLRQQLRQYSANKKTFGGLWYLQKTQYIYIYILEYFYCPPKAAISANCVGGCCCLAELIP